MYNYYTFDWNGHTIHVIKGQADSTHDVQISLMSDQFDRKIASQFHDSALESSGWSLIGVINGGIFNDQYAPTIYANGLEKSYWTEHEMYDDYGLDAVMAIGHYGDANIPIIDTQAAIRALNTSLRGAVTGAFGLLKNGVQNYGNIAQGSFSSLSGRSIIGRDSNNVIYFISTPGVTGSSGITGSQAKDLALYLGLYDAVCLDGGGSVSLIYQGSWKVSTTREIKNAFGLYVKQKDTGTSGGGETTPVISRKRNNFIPFFDKPVKWMIMNEGELVPVKDIQIKTPNGMVSIIDDEVKGE